MKMSFIILSCLSILGKNNVLVLGEGEESPAGGGFQNPGAGGQNPFGFQLPQFGGEQQKCFTSFESEGKQSCLQDLGNSFQSHQITLSQPCCSFLAQIDDACKSVVHFENPFFESLVKQHCSESYGGPVEATGAGAGAGDATNGAAASDEGTSTDGASTPTGTTDGASTPTGTDTSTPTSTSLATPTETSDAPTASEYSDQTGGNATPADGPNLVN